MGYQMTGIPQFETRDTHCTKTKGEIRYATMIEFLFAFWVILFTFGSVKN